MKAPEIVRKALRSVLLDINATEDEQRQAEALLDSLLDSSYEPQEQKPLPCESGIVKTECMLDQLWRNVEERHYDQLKAISARQCLLTTVELNIAIVCIRMVYSTIENGRSRRLVEAMKQEPNP